MLEGVNSIDWKRLGNSSIPRWLEGMTSFDLDIRRRAFHRIAVDVVKEDEISDGNLRPTSALSSEVPVHIVPSLIELAGSGAMQDRVGIIGFLNSLALYHVIFKDYEGSHGLTKEHLQRAEKMYQLIRDGERIYRKLLRDSDPHIRNVTQELLDTLGFPREQR